MTAMSRPVSPYVSLIVPAYNEESRLGPNLVRALAWLDQRGVPAEIIVVDDGSQDGTAALVEGLRASEPRIRLIRFPANRGKGAAVREGALAAAGRLILVSDADFSTPIEEFDRLLARMRETSSDVVIGSRALPGARLEVRQPFWREVMGRSFNRIMRTVTGLPFRDTQCGFKLFDRAKTAPILSKMVIERFAYDVELIWLSHLGGLRIHEEPVLWKHSTDSRVQPLRSSMSVFFDLLKLRRRIRRGYYREREKERAEARSSDRGRT